MSEVRVWQMTEEERLAYIEKHPIKPTKKAKKKAESEHAHVDQDYKWRGKKGAAARWGIKLDQ